MKTMQCGYYRFHYNSDLSGKVQISRATDGDRAFYIDGSALVEFVAEWVRNMKISEIEDKSPAEMLGVESIPGQWAGSHD